MYPETARMPGTFLMNHISQNAFEHLGAIQQLLKQVAGPKDDTGLEVMDFTATQKAIQLPEMS